MSTPSPYLKLPLSFDVGRLRLELAGIESSHWIGHFNTSAYEKNWSCIPLRSVDGKLDHIMPLEHANFQDTPILLQCPYFREVLDRFECEKTSVRLMSLESGAVIKEHRDEGSSLDDGIARLHIPIQTSAEVNFRIDGEEVHFSAGDTWYLNASCLHGVENRSPLDRIHLMLDCVTNPWLEQLFLAAGGVLREKPPYGDPAIDDRNVLQVIGSLRAGGSKREPAWPINWTLSMLPEEVLRRGTEVDHRELASLRQWFPVSLDQDPVAVWWRFVGARRFTDPFFEDSLMAQPPQERQACRTPLSVLEHPLDNIPPTAFIFHVSRCGSTLLTQMLAALPQCVVMSEPPVLDAFFRLHHHRPGQSGGVQTFRGLVAALGQRRSLEERCFFVKFDSWHMPWMPFVREAFPDTPIMLLYREPEEVLASHKRQRGAQMVPGLMDTSRLRPDIGGMAPGDLDAYAGKLLDAIFDEALQALPVAQPQLLNYSHLPAALWEDLSPRWRLDFSSGELQQLKRRAGFHSKHAEAAFAGDPKTPFAGPEKEMGRRSPAAHVYAQLEAARISCVTGRCLPSQ